MCACLCYGKHGHIHGRGLVGFIPLSPLSHIMALPPRKAGGLYGGIQFSSATAQAPSSSNDPAPFFEEEKTSKKEETTVVEAVKIQEPPKSIEAGPGKATAGIPYPLSTLLLDRRIKF